MEFYLLLLGCWMAFGALLVHSVKTEKTEENKKSIKDTLKSMPFLLRWFTKLCLAVYFLIIYLITPIMSIFYAFKKRKNDE